MPSLTITSGALAGQQFSFSESAVIGRGAYCDIRIDDSTVSRRHAEVTCGSDGVWRIHDLGSANGILHRGLPLRGELRIEGSVDLVIGEVAVSVTTTDAQATGQGARGRRTLSRTWSGASICGPGLPRCRRGARQPEH